MAHPVIEQQAVMSAQPSAAHDLSDAAFLSAFESCTLAADAFRHYDHIRLAWLYLGAAPLERATEKMAGAIRRFAVHHTGTSAKYDEALTRSWMRLVAHARATCATAPTFAVFAEANPMLFDRRRAFDFYKVSAA